MKGEVKRRRDRCQDRRLRALSSSALSCSGVTVAVVRTAPIDRALPRASMTQVTAMADGFLRRRRYSHDAGRAFAQRFSLSTAQRPRLELSIGLSRTPGEPPCAARRCV